MHVALIAILKMIGQQAGSFTCFTNKFANKISPLLKFRWPSLEEVFHKLQHRWQWKVSHRKLAWDLPGLSLVAYRRKDDNRRLRVEIAIRAIASEFYHRMTIALASENGYSWQCEWTQSHKNKNVRVKIATHGIANKLNRMMSTIAWVPSQWRLRLALQAIESKDAFVTILVRDMRLKQAILWDCVVRVPQVTKLVREMRLKVFNKTRLGGAARTASHDIGAIYAIENWHFFKKILRDFRARLVTLLARDIVEKNFHSHFSGQYRD